ncbi:MAG: TetR/AcrR family transcriptional regulator [Acidimicrobiales bacterium]
MLAGMRPPPGPTSVLPTPAKRAGAMPADDRRRMIVDATLPLLLAGGEMVTTRQIADAAGIAEGTIFRVFEDKDAVIAAVVERALDTEPLDRAVRAIPEDQPFEAWLEAAVVIIQQRVVDIWRLVSSIGSRFHDKNRGPQEVAGALVEGFAAHRDRLAVAPVVAARLLRALTLSVTHPVMVDEPMPPAEIVQLFLYGVTAGGSGC